MSDPQKLSFVLWFKGHSIDRLRTEAALLNYMTPHHYIASIFWPFLSEIGQIPVVYSTADERKFAVEITQRAIDLLIKLAESTTVKKTLDCIIEEIFYRIARQNNLISFIPDDD